MGKLGQFFSDKGRWAVQIDRNGEGCFESFLLRPDNLHRSSSHASAEEHVQHPQTNAPAIGSTTSGCLLETKWAGRQICFFGIQDYTSERGGDDIFDLIQHKFRPGVVLMESFSVGDDMSVEPGEVVPYRKVLPHAGLSKSLELVGREDFRQGLTAESVAVLTALRVGAEVRLGDRLHVTSFDRIIDRHSVLDLKHALVDTMEALAALLEGGASGVRLSSLPQNSFCPHFKELWSERHLLMAHFARQAAEQGHDTLVVIGAEHTAEVARLVHEGPVDAEALLQGSETTRGSESEEIEKRSVMSAFLSTTRAFPPEMVLPPKEQLLPEYALLVAKSYPKYRQAFAGRMEQASGQLVQTAFQGGQPRARGLCRLEELCKELEAA